MELPSNLITALKNASNALVLTGAGMSAESGVPTFRDAQSGLWSKFRPEELATPEAFRANPQMVWSWYLERRENIRKVSPHAGHRALVEMEQHFEDLLHSFKGHKHVIDVRNFGLMGSIEMAARDGAPGARGGEAHKKCFWEENLVIRNGMDILQFSPFLNSDPDEMEQSFATIRRVLDSIE